MSTQWYVTSDWTPGRSGTIILPGCIIGSEMANNRYKREQISLLLYSVILRFLMERSTPSRKCFESYVNGTDTFGGENFPVCSAAIFNYDWNIRGNIRKMFQLYFRWFDTQWLAQYNTLFQQIRWVVSELYYDSLSLIFCCWAW